MGMLMIGDFGIHNGVQTYRICGEKIDLHRLIDECREMGHTLENIPTIDHVRNGQWTMLLKLKVQVYKLQK